MVPVAGAYVAVARFSSKVKKFKGEDSVDFYHGTNSISAGNIRKNGVNLSSSKKALDFGPGFYTTTNKQQAIEWAARKAEGEVVHFRLSGSALSNMNNLSFNGATSSWGRFVRHFRKKGKMHSYDTVSGPMLRNVQGFLRKGKDPRASGQQTSWHTQEAIDILNSGIQ